MIVVDWILWSKSIAHVCAGDSVSLQEGRVVRSGAQGSHVSLGQKAFIALSHESFDVLVKGRPIASILHGPQGSSAVGRVLDLHRRMPHQRSQRGRCGELQVRTRHRDVNVEVRDNILAEPVAKVFTPLGRTDEPVLFGVPAGNNDRSHRFPSLCQQNRKPSHDFVDADRAAAGIGPAEDPGISVVADNDNLVLDMTWNGCENVPDGGHLCINLVDEADLFLRRSGVVFYITKSSGPIAALTDISRERPLAFERLEQG